MNSSKRGETNTAVVVVVVIDVMERVFAFELETGVNIGTENLSKVTTYANNVGMIHNPPPS